MKFKKLNSFHLLTRRSYPQCNWLDLFFLWRICVLASYFSGSVPALFTRITYVPKVLTRKPLWNSFNNGYEKFRAFLVAVQLMRILLGLFAHSLKIMVGNTEPS
uniref:Uncharacterized protein n=1 Tax=Micrurus surinamensis TaxID=129470 RepID=A0A2D4NLU9_MICSU